MASPGQAVDPSFRRDKKRRKRTGNPIHQSATPGPSSVGSSDEDPESMIICTQSGRILPGDTTTGFVPRRLKRQRFELGDRDSSEKKGRREQTQYKKRRVQASGSDSDSDAREEAESSRAGWQEESISEGLGDVVSLLEQVCENNRPISLSKRDLRTMAEDLRSAAEKAARNKRELVQKRNESTKHAGTLDALKQAVTCSICVDYYSDPHALSCGHMACKACLLLWFRSPSAFLHPIPGLNGRLVPLDRNVSYRTKICHVCRAPTFERPAPIHEFQYILEPLGVHSHANVPRRIGNDTPDAWTNIFPLSNQSYRLEMRNSTHCPNCLAELDGDRCEACDVEFSEAESETGDDDAPHPEQRQIQREDSVPPELWRYFLNARERRLDVLRVEDMDPSDDEIKEMAELWRQARNPTAEQERDMIKFLRGEFLYEWRDSAQYYSAEMRDDGDEDDGEDSDEDEEEEGAEREEDEQDDGTETEDGQDIAEDRSEHDDRSDRADERTNADSGDEDDGSSGSGDSQSGSESNSPADSQSHSSRSSRGSYTSSLHELNRGRQPVERDYAPGCTPEMDEGGYEYDDETGRWGHRLQQRHRNRERRHRRDSYDTPPGMGSDMDDENSFYDPDHSDDDSQFWSSSDQESGEESVEEGNRRGIDKREGTHRALRAESVMSEESKRQFDLSEMRRREMIMAQVAGSILTAKKPTTNTRPAGPSELASSSSRKRQRSVESYSDEW